VADGQAGPLDGLGIEDQRACEELEVEALRFATGEAAHPRPVDPAANRAVEVEEAKRLKRPHPLAIAEVLGRRTQRAQASA